MKTATKRGRKKLSEDKVKKLANNGRGVTISTLNESQGK